MHRSNKQSSCQQPVRGSRRRAAGCKHKRRRVMQRVCAGGKPREQRVRAAKALQRANSPLTTLNGDKSNEAKGYVPDTFAGAPQYL